MNTETAIIERMTLTGRFSDGISDIQAQTQLLDAGYRIVEVRTHGGDFIFIGERPYDERVSQLTEKLEKAQRENSVMLERLVDLATAEGGE